MKYFQFGVPKEDEYRILWDEQKQGGANRLDFTETYSMEGEDKKE